MKRNRIHLFREVVFPDHVGGMYSATANNPRSSSNAGFLFTLKYPVNADLI